MSDRTLYPVSRQHFHALGGPMGIWQHAVGSQPNEAFGSCTDDVARALIVDLLHARELGWSAVATDARRSLRYLQDAFDPVSGRFRNFRDRRGTWLDGIGSEDCHGRALLALGATIASAPDDELVDAATSLFRDALPAVTRLTALRASASALLGGLDAIDAGLRGDVERTVEVLTSRLAEAFRTVERRPDWPWPEPVLTYENALLPRAMLAAGARSGDTTLCRMALAAIDWLIDVQTTARGSFSAIGSAGWWPRGGARSHFDQQPIEATSTMLAAEAAFLYTARPRYLRACEAAYAWFLGDNDVGVALADPATGGCRDGLTPRGANLNQGAESTLMWLIALEHTRLMRSASLAVPSGSSAREPMLAGAAS